MLSDEVLEKVTERLTNRIEQGNQYILRKIGNSIDELGKLGPSQAQQLAQMIKYGGDYDKILKKLAKISKYNEKDIEKIFDEVAKHDYRFAKQFYDYRNIKYVPYDQNEALQNQVQAIKNTVKSQFRAFMNPRVLGYGMVNTITGEKIFKGLQDAYYSLLDEAVLNISQGKETFDQAMNRQIQAMGGGGLKVIYQSGHYRRLDSAIRMNMKDALRTLHNETQAIFGEQFGSNGVEISVHINPAPDHAAVQGKQFSNDEFRNFQNDLTATSYDGVVFLPEVNGRDRRSISEYNCYHYTFNIVLGVSKPQYTNEQLQEIIDTNSKGFEMDDRRYTNYQGTQIQRKLETEIRKQKDIQIMSKAAGKEEPMLKAQKKITELTAKYREVSEKAGLPTRMERMRVANYKRVNGNKVKKRLTK